MSFMQAVRSVLAQYATFSGRARRSEFWWFQLFFTLLIWGLFIVAGLLGAGALALDETLGAAVLIVGFIVAFVVMIGLFLPALAVQVRRMHDAGHSGWWILIGPVAFIFSLMDSQPDNQYGPSPKYPGAGFPGGFPGGGYPQPYPQPYPAQQPGYPQPGYAQQPPAYGQPQPGQVQPPQNPFPPQ